MREVLRVGGLGAVAALPTAALLGWLAAGAEGALGAVIGMGIAVGFLAVTVAVALRTASSSAGALGAWVLGSWLIKMIILVAALAVLRESDSYSRPALLIALTLGTLGSLALEARVILASREPYVEPSR
jgi:hypothetical protein